MAGQVRVDGHTETKAGTLVNTAAAIEVVATPRFVGRGGDKLAAARLLKVGKSTLYRKLKRYGIQ